MTRPIDSRAHGAPCTRGEPCATRARRVPGAAHLGQAFGRVRGRLGRSRAGRTSAVLPFVGVGAGSVCLSGAASPARSYGHWQTLGHFPMGPRTFPYPIDNRFSIRNLRIEIQIWGEARRLITGTHCAPPNSGQQSSVSWVVSNFNSTGQRGIPALPNTKKPRLSREGSGGVVFCHTSNGGRTKGAEFGNESNSKMCDQWNSRAICCTNQPGSLKRYMYFFISLVLNRQALGNTSIRNSSDVCLLNVGSMGTNPHPLGD